MYLSKDAGSIPVRAHHSFKIGVIVVQKIKAVIKKVFSPYFYGTKVFETKSNYNHIKVVDKKGYRYLIFDDPQFSKTYPEEIYQSCFYLKDPVNTPASYAYHFHLAFFLKNNIKSVLMIGLGCGLIPLQLLNKYPLEEFHAVEIDCEVVKAAEEYFLLPEDMRFKVFVNDGREFIDKNNKKYDFIILDAFFAKSMPYPLITRQFFAQVNKSLSENGIFALNVNGAFIGEKSKLFRSLHKTLKESFPYISLFAAKINRPNDMQNIIVYAFKEKNLLEEVIQKKERGLFNWPKNLNSLYAEEIINDDVEVFDDDKGLSELDIYGF